MPELYIVTGASGHLGYNLIKLLVEQKKKVRILVNKNIFLDDIDLNYIEIVNGSITNRDYENKLFEVSDKTDIIFIHCAGLVSIAKGFEKGIREININGTKNIVEMCIKHHVKKLVYVSSVHAINETDGIISEPQKFDEKTVVGGYAKTKAIATNIVLAAKDKIKVSVVCPSAIIGPNDYRGGYQTKMLDIYINKNIPAIINGGYDFVDVRDVAKGILQTVKLGENGEVFILSGTYITMKEIVNKARKDIGKKEIKIVIPNFIIILIAAICDLFYMIFKVKPLFTVYSLKVLNSNGSFSHDKATKYLNYNPRKIDETIKDTANFLIKK